MFETLHKMQDVISTWLDNPLIFAVVFLTIFAGVACIIRWDVTRKRG